MTARNIVEKVLHDHLREGVCDPGKDIGIRIDQTLVHDATGTMAFLQFEALGRNAVKTDLSVTYIDHNTQQIGFENSDDHLYLQSVSAKFGAVYSRAGNGICHQVHLERFGKPGTTLLGADSHTPTGGGLGQFAVGAGGLDVAVAMGGGPFHLACPRVYQVKLAGRLRAWVSAKDVVLHLLSVLTTRGNVGVVLEYAGEGLKTLSVPERATIANMGAEMGVTTSIFPSDEVTRRFLKAQGREGDWVELSADPGARYERVVAVDLSLLEPLAAAAAVTGRLTAPGRLGIACPKIQEPDAYGVDDGMFIFPSGQISDTPVFRGPNIGEPPRSEKMTADLDGRVMIKLGDNITTDHITPAGARLKYRSNVPKYAEFVFENIDPLFSRRCLENKSKGIHNIVAAGESYGQGSSREHASMCPMYLGVKAVIAKSFERIHSANLINFGVLPLVFRHPADYDGIEADDRLSAANWREAVAQAETIVVRNERSGAAIACTCELSEKQTAVVLAGGLLNHITSA
jgi:aconitase A